MDLEKITFPRLQNGEHEAFHRAIAAIIDKISAEALGVVEQSEAYHAALSFEQVVMADVSKQDMASERTKRDKRRDRAFSAFKAYLKVFANDADENIAAAAERLLHVIRMTTAITGNPLALGQVKESSALNALLRVLDTLQTDISTIGASVRYNELVTAVREFDELKVEQTIDKTGTPTDVKAARVATDEAYRKLIEHIYAQAVLKGIEPSEIVKRVDDKVELTADDRWAVALMANNSTVDEFKNIVARRLGKLKTAKTNETVPANPDIPASAQ